jgi:hypothetical protein
MLVSLSSQPTTDDNTISQKEKESDKTGETSNGTGGEFDSVTLESLHSGWPEQHSDVAATAVAFHRAETGR